MLFIDLSIAFTRIFGSFVIAFTMNSRGTVTGHRLSSATSFRSRSSFLILSMFATMAAFYVAGRLWQDAGTRVYLIKELDKHSGQGRFAVSVDDTLKIIDCREQQKKLAALQMDLEKAKQEGYVLKQNSGTHKMKKLLAVIGIMTKFGRKNNREAIRKAWMPRGSALRNLEEEKGIIIRFVIGRSGNHGDNLDKDIDNENMQAGDFMILNDVLEAPEERSKKVKLFFANAVEQWDAEFYIKANDDIYVNIDALGAVLASHLDKPSIYIGCMKSGEVFSQPSHKWYFRHASGEIYAISQTLAHFISINRSLLRTYAHDDVTAGSWLIGIDIEHIDERKFCCSWSSGSICSTS